MQQNEVLESYIFIFILTGLVTGFLSRLWMLKSDVRQYPTLPDGE